MFPILGALSSLTGGGALSGANSTAGPSNATGGTLLFSPNHVSGDGNAVTPTAAADAAGPAATTPSILWAIVGAIALVALFLFRRK